MMMESFSQIHAKRVAEGLEDCDPSCLNATDTVCKCSCQGKNHGRDAAKNRERLNRLNHKIEEFNGDRVPALSKISVVNIIDVEVAEVRRKVNSILDLLEQIEIAPEEQRRNEAEHHGGIVPEVLCLGNVFREARLTALSRLEDMDVGS